MNSKGCRSSKFKKYIKKVFFVSCCGLCFVLGNLFTTISFDPTKCDVSLCSKIALRTGVDNSNHWSKLKSSSRTAFLVILILSSPTNHKQRDAIRQTWLSEEFPDTVHYFVVGTNRLSEGTNITIHSEQKRFGDLLLLQDIADSYMALPKKLLSSMLHLHNNIKFQFLLKTDDDTYVNLPQLYLDLSATPYTERLYWGFFDGRATPKKGGPWKETEWVLCDHYLPYAMGGGYIISYDLVSYIAINSKLFKLYNSEDVSVGTWLAPLDLHRVHDPRFDTEYKSRGCNNKYIVTHKQNVIHMLEKFNSLKSSGLLCKEEFKVRKSYNYNWSVPPSKCCIRNDSAVP